MNKFLPLGLGAIAVIGIGAFVGLGGSTAPGTSTPGTTTLSPVAPANAQSAGEDVTILEDFVLGSDDAPITMIEYASFTCPHCADFHERAFDQLKAEYIDTGKVRFINREVYFDKYGLWAGMVAQCGGEMRYYGIVDMLFEGQKDWIGNGQEPVILENLKTIGKTAGLSEEAIVACMNDQAMAQAMVATYQQNSTADEIRGTPTFIINGETHSNMTYKDLKEILDGLLDG